VPSRPRPRLLAVDLDGTLLDHSGVAHAGDVKAIRALLASGGVAVSILTGRLYSGTRATAEALGLTGPVACVDGSHLVDASTHRTVFHRGIKGAHALMLRDGLARHGPATFLFAKDAVVHDEAGAPFLGYVSTWSTEVVRAVRVVEHELWGDVDGITAVVAVGTNQQISGAASDIQANLDGVVQAIMFPVSRIPSTWGLVVRACGGTKGTALQWLANHYGCEMEETVVVGDWLNDVTMFSVAGRSFAMGQAPDEVKRAASDVLPETSETGGGIARVVREVFGVRV
jgi:hydroxymethylpyrimidine pyrophosphatase-like HAD family hydrolase